MLGFPTPDFYICGNNQEEAILFLYDLTKFIRENRETDMKYNDELMLYIANNTQSIFKEDIRLFHSGFPSSNLYKKSNIVNIDLDESHQIDDHFDLNEVLLDFEYRVKSIQGKIEKIEDTG